MDANEIDLFAIKNLAAVFYQAKEINSIKKAHHLTESAETINKIVMKPYTAIKSRFFKVI